MTDWLLGIGSLWIWILLGLVLVFLLVLLILSTVVRRASRPAAIGAMAGPVPSPAPEAPPGEAEAEPPAPAETASGTFSRAMKFLRATVAGRDYRYQIPWFLVAGDPGSGKSALLRAVGTNLHSQVDGGGRSALEWRFLDRGILIAAAGRYFKGGSTRAEHDWGRLLKLLQNNRPRRPIDGVVLTIDAADLVGSAALDETQLSARAARYGEMLAQAQRTLGFLFPVYVIVTKCDQIEGFDAFCRELPPQCRDEVFGWSSPYQLDASFTPDWVEEAFTTVAQELQRLQSEIFVESAELSAPEDVFLFPEEFMRMRAPLTVYLDRLFRETAYREAFRFRGLYFCGDFTPYETPAPQAAVEEQPPVPAFLGEIAPPEPPPAPLAVRKAPAFVKRLFDEKIFAEGGVARPLARVFLTRSRTVTYIQVAAAVLAVILAAGTWLSYRRLAGDRDRLLPALLIMTDRPASQRTAEQARSFGIGLLQRMDAAATVDFQSVFQPASWFSPLDGNVTSVMRSACEQWIFSAIQTVLVQRKNALLYPPPPQPETAVKAEEGAEGDGGELTLTSLDSSPEYQRLVTFVNDLTLLHDNTTTYENLRQQGRLESLDRIRRLLVYLDLSEIHPRGHLGSALQQANGPPARFTPNDVEAASETIRKLIAELLHNWFENNQAWNDVEQLRQGISDLQRAQITDYKGLTDLLAKINQVQNDFTDPNFRWLSNTSLALPVALKRVSVNPLVEPPNSEIEAFTRQQGEGYFNQLRNKLRDARTTSTDLLLDLKDPIDLSTGTSELRLAVQNTVNLPFVATRVEPAAIHVTLEPNRRLIWRLDPLREAVRLTGIYTVFVRDGLRGVKDPLPLSRIALDHLTRQVQDLIAQAQSIQPRPAGVGARSEDETLPEVNAFRDAEEPLVQLAEQFNSLGQSYIHNAVLRIMVLQAFNLLTLLDTRLNDEQPYSVKEGAWTGRGSLALAVFDVPTAPALKEHLDAQRDRVKFFEQQAEPLVPFLTQYMPVRAAVQNQLIAKWQRITDDFHQYDQKRPGATLAALEDFITTGLDKMAQNACRTDAPDQRPDYFIQVKNGLESRLGNRCRDVQAAIVCASYARIAGVFNETLAGKFPFAALAQGKTQPEAKPEDITAFFQVMDANAKAARAALEDDRFGQGGQRARDFLDQIEQLRPLVVPGSPETDKEPPLTLDLVPQFRVNRANESGANQVINWTMQIGSQIFQQKDPEHPGRWRASNPVRLSLRWANDSMYVPAPDPGQPNLTIRDRNAYFEFTNTWSLLAFLRRYEALPSDLVQSGDPQPYTLKLRVKTALDQKWAASESNPATGTATVFLHMRIMQAGAKNPRSIPPFPTAAPDLGTGCPN